MRYIDLEKLITLKGANWKQKKNKWQDPELKKDFREYSYNKCWYSECKLTGNDIDIDHFRPKKAVLQYNDYAYNEKLEKCGYFWLKEEVKNYRGSCIYSNRIRKKGKKTKPDEKGGKGPYFPLRSKNNSKYGKRDISWEVPMLLDPCVKEDVKLLTFVAGEPACSSTNEIDRERVRVSIDLYNLDNIYISMDRQDVWDEAMDAIETFERTKDKDGCIRRLRKLTDRKNQFSSVAIAVVNSWNNDEIKSKLDLDL